MKKGLLFMKHSAEVKRVVDILFEKRCPYTDNH